MYALDDARPKGEKSVRGSRQFRADVLMFKTMADDYDVDRETEFNREKLQTAIPNRLRELGDIITSRKSSVDSWYANLITKILLSVGRTSRDLLKTMEEESVSPAAWNARNLLELWVWIKYCAASQENARRFYEDSLRDMQGLTDAPSRLHELKNSESI